MNKIKLDGLPQLEEVEQGYLERLLSEKHSKVIGSQRDAIFIRSDQIRADQFPNLPENAAYAIARLYSDNHTILITIVYDMIGITEKCNPQYITATDTYRPTHEATYLWKERLFPKEPKHLKHKQQKRY
ncbi:hypothetical protein HY640_00780 [Candidatus Woesearchaeota archaeon]|nr:hypothetical protein [Candidatus Woesearchaeota archaeon]